MNIMKVGLYFGSFNPVHIGHLIIASFVVNQTEVEQVWFIVSPQNPLKKSHQLLNEYHRLYLLQLAIEEETNFRASDIEFKLPRPSYTIDTLSYLQEKYPGYEFFIIMGSDSFLNLPHWKNYQKLIDDYKLLVYTRPGFQVSSPKQTVEILNAPMLDISATYIRNLIKQKKSIRYLVPEKVRLEIEQNHYYK